MLHLKRFLWVDYYTNKKITDMVQYPIQGLDLSEYINPRPGGTAAASSGRGSKGNRGRHNKTASGTSQPPSYIYDLYAVTLHEGNLAGGHYTALCKNWIKGNWLYFNDRSVE